jgi:hypothetical protein
VATFWGDQGLGIPITGDTMTGQTIVINDLATGFSINDTAGQSFGNVDDFVIDRSTGEIVYAILSNTAGDSFYAVPFSHLQWSPGADPSMGGFSFSGDATRIDTAPSFTSLDDFSFDLLDEVDTFWGDVTE